LVTHGLAQVTISPTSIFVNSKEPFGTFLVLNGTDKTQEVSISFPFGYPGSDSTGKIIMNYSDTAMADKFSIEQWVSGFPRSFVLEPNQRQVVRVTVRPTEILSPGTYWTIIKTKSNEVAPEIGVPQKDKITAEIRFVFEQITTLLYQSGELSTGLKINDLRTKIDDHNATVISDVEKTGNSPFLGTMEVKIFNSAGAEVKRNQVFVSIYMSGSRKLDVGLDDLPPGQYSAEVKFYPNRMDIPEHFNITAESVIKMVNFNL